MAAAVAAPGRTPQNTLRRASFVDSKSPRSLVARALSDSQPSSPQAEAKKSPAFTSQGFDKSFCDKSSREGRLIHCPLDQKPDVGWYRPDHRSVSGKAKQADFALRSAHETRKEYKGGQQDGAVWHQELASPRLTAFANFPTDLAGHRGLFDFDSERPELRKTAMVTMNEMPMWGKEWHTRDDISSKVTRQPRWDFEKLPSRKDPDPSGMVYYQPAMYEVQHEVVLPSLKRPVEFSKQVGYKDAPGQLGHLAPQGVLHPPQKSKGATLVTPDRSLFRSNLQVSPRVLCVKDLSKLPARDALFKPGASWHDESDPKADEEVLEWERTFDSLAAKQPVIPRTDYAPSMGLSLTRSKAKSGVRPLPGFVELNRECTDNLSKERPSRLREGAGTTPFDLRTGREPAQGGAASPLRRSRSDAAPAFARTAPAGFTTRASLSVGRLRGVA